MGFEEITQVAKARLASGLTIEDARKAVGLTYPPYKAREENPEAFTLGELRKLSHVMNDDGKRILNDWLDIFLDI